MDDFETNQIISQARDKWLEPPQCFLHCACIECDVCKGKIFSMECDHGESDVLCDCKKEIPE